MSNINGVHIISFMQNKDEKGMLSIVEGGETIPFDIKRVFYIYGVNEGATRRGQHSNRKTEFVLVSISGSCKVLVKDGLGNEEVYCLDNSNQGLYLPKLLWKEMYDFSEDCILLALASEHYDAQEYIRSLEELKEEMERSI